MSKELYSVIHQSTLHEIIIRKIQEFVPTVGNTADGSKLSDDVVKGMNEVANEIAITVDALNRVFIDKNLTAVSARDYANFLCSLLPEYIFAPTSQVDKHELESITIMQMENTPVELMREHICYDNFNSQSGETIMSLEHIKTQVALIDDATIKEAYRTKILNQLNLQVQQPQF